MVSANEKKFRALVKDALGISLEKIVKKDSSFAASIKYSSCSSGYADIPIVSDVSKISSQASSHTQKLCQCKARILIVDDNPFNLMSLSYMIEQTFKVTSDKAENGMEALKQYKENREKKCCQIYY